MGTMQHPVFGDLETDSTGGIFWEGKRKLSDRIIDVELTVMGPASRALLDKAAPFASMLASFDAEARACLRTDHDESPDSAVALYVEHHLEELSPEVIRRVFGKANEAVDLDTFLGAVSLCRVGIYPDEPERCAVFDYTIGKDETQYLLVVTFDDEGEVAAIDMES